MFYRFGTRKLLGLVMIFVFLSSGLIVEFKVEASFMINESVKIMPLGDSITKAIFSDGFETGNFNAWTSGWASGTGASRTVQSTATHHGTYAAKFVKGTDARKGAGIWKIFAGIYSLLYARAYVRLSATPASGVRFAFGPEFSDTGLSDTLAEAGIYNNAGTLNWDLQYKTDTVAENHEYSTAAAISVNTWYCVEVMFKAGAGTGEARVWIDGVERITVTGLTNDDVLIGALQIVAWSAAATNFTSYFDCVVVADTYIKPEEPSPVRFYDFSDRWTTILGNPTGTHTFQPVHNTTIIEVNKIVDGTIRKYLAYNSDPVGSKIWLYYANDIGGLWTSYSGNPILGPNSNHYRWPSVTYIDGTFHMFLTDRTDLTLERWTSTDGIHYTFRENVKTGGDQYKNSFIWFNSNDGKWYLYYHDMDASSGVQSIKVRNAAKLEDLDAASDVLVLSRPTPIGSPTVMYYNGMYWLLAEVLDLGSNMWKIVAYYSNISPSSGFKECENSPVLSNDEACPMLFLGPTRTRAYLFSNRDKTRWYQDTREVLVTQSLFP